jgi:hypothetical protein
MSPRFVEIQFALSTAEEERNQFQAVPSDSTGAPEERFLPAGLYRVIGDQLFYVQKGVPMALQIAQKSDPK